MIRDWLRIASTKPIVVRGLKYGLIVGKGYPFSSTSINM